MRLGVRRAAPDRRVEPGFAILDAVVEGGASVRLRGAAPRRLARGEAVSFGRSAQCDLRIGSAADGQVEDTGVSRLAGTLLLDDSGVTVANASTSRVIVVRPPVGPERIVGTGEALTLVTGPFTVVLNGQVYVHTLDVHLDARPARPLPVDDSPPTTMIVLRDRERRYCVALCEPLLDSAGGGEPATYRQAAERLGVAPASVRKVVDGLRQRLAAQGFQGVEGDHGRDSLVHLLVETGTVSPSDLELL